MSEEEWSAEEAFESCRDSSHYPWFSCMALSVEFFWFLLIMLVLLLLSAALEFAFEKLDDLEAFGGELFARVKSELTILGALSFCMFAVVATEMLTGYKQELVELIHFMLFIAALFYCLLVMSFLVIRSRLRRAYQTHHAWLREATPEQLQELEAVTPQSILRCCSVCRSLDLGKSTSLRGSAYRPNAAGAAGEHAPPMRRREVRMLCKLLVARRSSRVGGRRGDHLACSFRTSFVGRPSRAQHSELCPEQHAARSAPRKPDGVLYARTHAVGHLANERQREVE